jgi:hypothetical protein
MHMLTRKNTYGWADRSKSSQKQESATQFQERAMTSECHCKQADTCHSASLSLDSAFHNESSIFWSKRLISRSFTRIYKYMLLSMSVWISDPVVIAIPWLCMSIVTSTRRQGYTFKPAQHQSTCGWTVIDLDSSDAAFRVTSSHSPSPDFDLDYGSYCHSSTPL